VSHFIKIRPVGAEFLHADREKDGRTDMKKHIFSFRSFANAPKKDSGNGETLDADSTTDHILVV
jgi:hypothetical protein